MAGAYNEWYAHSVAACENFSSPLQTLAFLFTLQCSDKLGLSLELGSFVAGVMISTTDFAQHTLDQVLLYYYRILFY